MSVNSQETFEVENCFNDNVITSANYNLTVTYQEVKKEDLVNIIQAFLLPIFPTVRLKVTSRYNNENKLVINLKSGPIITDNTYSPPIIIGDTIRELGPFLNKKGIVLDCK